MLMTKLQLQETAGTPSSLQSHALLMGVPVDKLIMSL